MIAAVGLGWYPDFKACAEKFVHIAEVHNPIPANVAKYDQLYEVYQQVYLQTVKLVMNYKNLKNKNLIKQKSTQGLI